MPLLAPVANVLKNKMVVRVIIGIVIAFILYLFIRKYWHRIVLLTQSSDIDWEPGESKVIPNAREAELKGMAADLYSDIYDTPTTGHTNSLYIDANDLSDNELKYLAKYYRKQLTQGTYLYTDVDNEWFGLAYNFDTRLMVHLAKIGEKGE